MEKNDCSIVDQWIELSIWEGCFITFVSGRILLAREISLTINNVRKDCMALFRSYPEYSTPDSVVDIVKEIIDSKKYQIELLQICLPY